MTDKYPSDEIKDAVVESEMEKIKALFPLVEDERRYQVTRFGIEDDDRKNMPNDWVAYITHYSTRWFTGGFPPYKDEAYHEFKRCMIKVATLALAAVTWADRRIEMHKGKREF